MRKKFWFPQFLSVLGKPDVFWHMEVWHIFIQQKLFPNLLTQTILKDHLLNWKVFWHVFYNAYISDVSNNQFRLSKLQPCLNILSFTNWLKSNDVDDTISNKKSDMLIFSIHDTAVWTGRINELQTSYEWMLWPTV